ncbi:MAG: hypothetical protein ABMA26_12035 [Limisphaerales bacterium]
MEVELAELLQRKRAYAPYFCLKDDKAGTERGVVSDWLFARYGCPEEHFVRLQSSPEDPPDVVLLDKEGGHHGIEVTELVDGPTIRACDKSQLVFVKEFADGELSQLVLRRISDKSANPFKRGPFASKRLLIYSDEPTIAFCPDIDFLTRFPSSEQHTFDEIWFVIPPEVNTSGGEPENPYCRIFPILTNCVRQPHT